MAESGFEESVAGVTAAQVGAQVTEVVECRQRADLEAGSWFWLLIGDFFCVGPWIGWTMHRQTDVLALLGCISLLGALFLGVGLSTLLWYRRGRVIADQVGLRWRGAGRWRSATWEEVNDYYEADYSRNGSTILIETEAGKILLAMTHWTHGPDLKAAVQARALRTRTRSWAKRGARAEDNWPRVFGYNAEKNRRAVWGGSVLLGGLQGSPILMVLLKSTPARFGPGWQWSLAGFGLMELMMGLFGLVYASAIQDYRDALRRRSERITADAEGITYEDGLRRVKIAWQDIRVWRVGCRTKRSLAMRTLYTIATDTDSFTFTRCLDDCTVLRDWISSHLGRKPDLEETDEPLRGAVSEVTDRNVYTYRTRDNRALLLLPMFLAPVSLAPFLIPMILPSDRPVTLGDTVFKGCFAAAMWIGALFIWGSYRRARVETDKDGITEHRLFRVRRLAWNEIRSYAMVQDAWMGHAEVVGTQEKIRFGPMLAHFDQLKAEIALRATARGTSEWNALPRREQM